MPTYADLTAAKTADGSIRNWVNDSRIPAERVLKLAQDFLSQRVRVSAMRKRLATILSTDEDSLDITAEMPDFLDPQDVYLGGWVDPIEHIPQENFEPYRQTDENGDTFPGPPGFYTIVEDTMLFDVKADQDYPLLIWYYARPPYLGITQQTNLFTEKMDTALHFACMGMAYQHRKDEKRASAYLQMALAEAQASQITDDQHRRAQRFNMETYHG